MTMMWKTVILCFVSFSWHAVNAQETFKCYTCWYLDEKPGNMNPNNTGIIVNALTRTTGVDSTDTTTTACRDGYRLFPAWNETTAEAMGEYECDGMCTARVFEINDPKLDIYLHIFQRTCMTRQILENQPCLPYVYDSESGRPFGLDLLVTSSCCTGDHCNTEFYPYPVDDDAYPGSAVAHYISVPLVLAFTFGSLTISTWAS